MSTHASDRIFNRMTDEEIKDLNAYHNHPDKGPRFAAIREAFEQLIKVIYAQAPECQDRAMAIQATRAATLWANSAIALEKTV